MATGTHDKDLKEEFHETYPEVWNQFLKEHIELIAYSFNGYMRTI